MQIVLKQYGQPLRWWWFWFALACGLILVLCWLSLTSIDVPFYASDKTLHAVAYWGVALWWLQLFRQRWAMLLIALATVALGASLEVAQAHHPLRHFDWYDMLANALGAGLALLCARLGCCNLLGWFELAVLRLGR